MKATALSVSQRTPQQKRVSTSLWPLCLFSMSRARDAQHMLAQVCDKKGSESEILRDGFGQSQCCACWVLGPGDKLHLLLSAWTRGWLLQPVDRKWQNILDGNYFFKRKRLFLLWEIAFTLCFSIMNILFVFGLCRKMYFKKPLYFLFELREIGKLFIFFNQ